MGWGCCLFCFSLLFALYDSASDALCDAAVCTYFFDVHSTLAMTFGQERVYARNSTLYYRDWNAAGVEKKVPTNEIANILTLDGFYRTALTVNGTVPGPTIEVYEGTEIVVHMTNNLDTGPVTLHWHGQYQRGSPWMDGVSQVTQCAVLPGTSFTYRFVAEPAGTQWYHSHHGLQRPDGLYGPLIVHKREPSVHDSVCDIDKFVVTLSDWYHEDSSQVFWKRIGPGFYPNGPEKPPYHWTRSPLGRLVGEVPFESALFNGKGRYKDGEGRWSETPLEVFEVPRGKVVCFRVIGAMMEKAFRISIDQHDFQVIASDGHEVDPVSVESVIIHPGETFDIAVATNALPGSYYVRAKTLAVQPYEVGYAVLQYEGISPSDPASVPRGCTPTSPCVTLNCPFPHYPKDSNRPCLSIDSLRSQDDAPEHVTPGQEHFLNFVFGPLGVNRRRFVQPSSPPLTQPDDAIFAPCPNSTCNKMSCNCTHVLSLPFNSTVQLVLANVGEGAYGMHPVHLHGYSFQVLKVGYPTQDGDNETQNTDIACEEGTWCSVAWWRRRPELNIVRPPWKNTVVVPAGGYAVVRLKIDNPGWWHLHCHMAHHLYWGLGMLVNAAPTKQYLYPPPPGFPRCGNYEDTHVVEHHGVHDDYN